MNVCGICASDIPLSGGKFVEHDCYDLPCGGSGMKPEDTYDNHKVRVNNSFLVRKGLRGFGEAWRNRSFLQAEVKSWVDEKFDLAHRVCRRYGFDVPTEFLRELSVEDLDVAEELFNESLMDTSARDAMLSSLCSKLGIRSWPTYGEGEKVFEAFLDLLGEKLNGIGGALTKT